MTLRDQLEKAISRESGEWYHGDPLPRRLTEKIASALLREFEIRERTQPRLPEGTDCAICAQEFNDEDVLVTLHRECVFVGARPADEVIAEARAFAAAAPVPPHPTRDAETSEAAGLTDTSNVDLSVCAYYRGVGTCSFGCSQEPACVTDRPEEGWPAERAPVPHPTRDEAINLVAAQAMLWPDTTEAASHIVGALTARGWLRVVDPVVPPHEIAKKEKRNE